MALIHDIQANLLDEAIGVGSILLKVKFLASKLDVEILEEWVQHETEGYPKDAPVPEYREASISYTGTFVNPAQKITTAIPGYLISQYAREDWLTMQIRESVSVIDSNIKNRKPGSHFGIDCSNLKLLLEGKVYEGMALVSLEGRVSDSAFVNIQHLVRSKTLDFVLRLEKQVPAASSIEVGQAAKPLSAEDMKEVKNLTQQIFLGNVTQITNTGAQAQVNIKVEAGNREQLLKSLTDNGIAVEDAQEVIDVAVAEGIDPEKGDVGPKVKSWIADKLSKGAAEAWGVGKNAAQQVIVSAVKQYFGL